MIPNKIIIINDSKQNNNNKKNEDQFWNIKKLKRDEIEKAYQI
jgi:hypothetical protein